MPNVRQLLLMALLVAAIVSGRGIDSTAAAFSTSATAGENLFRSGTLRLGAGVAANSTLTLNSLVPGNVRTASLVIANGGTLDLRYASTTDVAGYPDLANAMRLTIRSRGPGPCSSQDGALLYGPGPLTGSAIGDPAHGPHPGDRALAAGASEELCFTLEFLTSDTTLQARAITTTFTFAAEQP